VRNACADSATKVTPTPSKGVFRESRSGGRQVVIAHETIPGYMEAMTMPFQREKACRTQRTLSRVTDHVPVVRH